MRVSAFAAALAVIALWPLAAIGASAQPRLQLSTGLDYSSGKFGGASRTEVLVAPFAARVTTGPWAFRASIPYISVRGDQAVIGSQVFVVVDDNGGLRSSSGSGRSGGSDDSEAVTTTTTTTVTTQTMRRVTQTGLGDLSLSATYSFNDLGDAPVYLDLVGRVRLPTGDDGSGLGLGVTDYGLSGELGYDVDAGGAYVSAGRRFLADAQGIKREDGWQAGIGGWLNAGARTTVGAFADWRESTTGRGEDPAEAGAYVSYKVTPALKVGLNASAGLNDASPDYAVGLSLTWRANERRTR